MNSSKPPPDEPDHVPDASDGPLAPLEWALRDRVRADEAAYGKSSRSPDSLWDHLERVARIAERLGRLEGLDPAACRLAGLFHDAGKFSGGAYHVDRLPEEEQSVSVLRDLATAYGVEPRLIDEIASAIGQLYRDELTLSPLASVLFDADNLDKLGAPGVANFFVKTGLRGRGLSRDLLHRLTVELTYAHHAPDGFRTASGRALAGRRAAETMGYHHRLLETLREDGLYDFGIEEVEFQGILLMIVESSACECGGKLARRIWCERGVKCTEIHLEHRCEACGRVHRMHFCRPRLAAPEIPGECP